MWELDDPEINNKLVDEEVVIREIFSKERINIYDYAVRQPIYAPNGEIIINFYEYDLETGRIWCNLSSNIDMPDFPPIFSLLALTLN